MDDGSLSPLLILLGLLLTHALVMAGHGALNNVRILQLRERAEEGDTAAKRVLAIVDGKGRAGNSFQVIFVLLQIGIAGTVFALAETVAFNSTAPGWLIYGLAMLLGTMLVMIFGVLVPEAVGSSHPTSISRALAAPLMLLMLIVMPLTQLLVSISRIISTLFASSSKVATVTEEEIMTLVDAGLTEGTIEAEEQEMIYSVLQLNDTRASELMVPRIDMVAMSTNTSLEDARAMFIQSGHSRIPVFDETIDNIKGVLYAKDLLAHWHNGSSNTTVSALMRPAYFVPETKPADELLRELQSRRVHMAIVVDEYGGTAGIVTIENLIEEIIGDIRDEYDEREEAEYVRISETQYVVDASMDLDDLNDLLDIDLPSEDSDTLGGFIYTHFGRVPHAGEEILREDDDLLMRIETVNGRRIGKVTINKLQRDEETGEIETVKNSDSSAANGTSPKPNVE